MAALVIFHLGVSTGEYHRSNGNVDYQFQLEIWKGNLTGALEVAIRKRQLNDWLVSLSPLGRLTTTHIRELEHRRLFIHGR